MELREKTYIIKGKPIPWARSRTNNGMHFDSQKKEKLFYGLEMRNQHEGEDMFEGPLHLDITFFMPIPSSLSQNKRREIIGVYHASRPDLDNMVKFIKDAATGILYLDDNIISSIAAHKVYSTNPHTKITIKELNELSVCLC